MVSKVEKSFKFSVDDSSRMENKDLMEWVKLSRKGMNGTTTLQEFERQFGWLVALDKTIFDSLIVYSFRR